MSEEILEIEEDDINLGSVDIRDAARQTIQLPNFWTVPISKYYDYDQHVRDYTDFKELNDAINAARRSLFMLTEKLNIAERKLKNAEIDYERQYRRAYILSNEKTDMAKKARAAIVCENLENDKFKYEQYKNELTRMSFVIKSELESLQLIANNFRAELRS